MEGIAQEPRLSCRAVDAGRLAESLGAAVQAVLARAEAGVSLGQGKASKAQRKEQAGAWELHWSALVAARGALQGGSRGGHGATAGRPRSRTDSCCCVAGRALSKLAVNSSVGIVSPEAGGARHALALLTLAMREVSSCLAGCPRQVGAHGGCAGPLRWRQQPLYGHCRTRQPCSRRTKTWPV